MYDDGGCFEGGVCGGVYMKREELDGFGGCIDKRTFSGLMSLWKNPWAWICCNAEHTCHLQTRVSGDRMEVQCVGSTI